jgi:hypothetical protein
MVRSSDWHHYDEKEKQCKHCQLHYLHSGKRYRVVKHLNSCLKFKKKIQQKEAAEPSWFVGETRKKKVNIQVFLQKLMLSFTMNGVPFSLIEKPDFSAALKELIPTISLPSRNTFSTKILTSVYRKVQLFTIEEIKKHDSFCLSLDASTNVEGNSIINIGLISSTGSFLLDLVNPKGESQTAEYLFNLLQQQMTSLGSSSEQVSGVVTDNCSTNKKMWKLFEDIYPDKFAYGCAAHAANLLVKDIFQIPTAPAPLLAFRCQRLANCLLLVREITIIMKNILKLKADLNALQTTNGKKKLSLPCFTRWSSNYESVENFYNSLDELRMVISSRKFIDEAPLQQKDRRRELKEKLQSPDFERDLCVCKQILTILQKFIILFQDNKTAISEVLPAFKKMLTQLNAMNSLSMEEKTFILQKARERSDFISHPVHCYAILLDPTKDGNAEFNSADLTKWKNDMFRYCQHCSPGVDLGKINRITAEYADYLKDIKTRVKNKDQLLLMIKNNQENRQVLDYWMEVETRFPLLSHLALKIFKLPVSSAYMERTFSIDKFIHCKSRNRLLDEKTKKLVIIKLNAPLLSNQANLFGEEDPQAIGENHQEESNHEEEEEEEEFHDNFETGDDGEVDSVMDDDD